MRSGRTMVIPYPILPSYFASHDNREAPQPVKNKRMLLGARSYLDLVAIISFPERQEEVPFIKHSEYVSIPSPLVAVDSNFYFFATIK